MNGGCPSLHASFFRDFCSPPTAAVNHPRNYEVDSNKLHSLYYIIGTEEEAGEREGHAARPVVVRGGKTTGCVH